MIPIKNNPDCYIVNVPGEATVKWKTMPDGSKELIYPITDEDGNNGTAYLKVSDSKYELIGEITADHIGFDARFEFNLWSNHEMYSLLEASGVYFKNPYGEKPDFKNVLDSSKYRTELDIWQAFNSKLTQKSILIKKV